MEKHCNNHISQILEEYFINEKKRELEIKNNGFILTGIEDLDKNLGGIHNGDVVLIGGRPLTGYKTFITELIYKTANKFKENKIINSNISKNILYFYTGYNKNYILPRLIARTLKISFCDVKYKIESGIPIYQIFNERKQLSSFPLYLFDNNSIDDVCEYIINFNNDSNIGLVIIDNLQNLVNCFDVDFSFQLEQAMQKIKNTAKNLNVPIIVVSDLNEDIEYREDDTPLISDINVGYSDIDGGFKKIVKYSDKVLLTHRDIYRLSYNKPTQKEGETSEHFIYRLSEWTEDCKKAQNTYNIIIAKNNFGKLETVTVHSNYVID